MRIVRALVCLLLLPLSGTAGTPAQQFVTPDEQAYYLYSAFLAVDSPQRPRLHHIGALYQKEVEQTGDQSVDPSTEGAWYISNLLEGYPARNAGLKRGDRVLLVDGRPFHPVHAFNGALQDNSGGRVGSNAPRAVKLTVLRNGTEMTVPVTPVYENLYDAYRNATQNSVSRYPSGNKIVCYVHWWSASRSLADLIADRALFESLRACDGLILDLRDSMGFFDWQHLDHFFGSRRSYPRLVYHNAPAGAEAVATDKEYLAPPAPTGTYFGRPMAVLTNGGTRGGMELVAWHLINSGRALSAGEPSAGLMPGTIDFMHDDSAVTLVPDKRLSIGGKTVERAAPRMAVDWPLFTPSATDPQFDAALFALMGII